MEILPENMAEKVYFFGNKISKIAKKQKKMQNTRKILVYLFELHKFAQQIGEHVLFF
jgi:hypothetical protein